MKTTRFWDYRNYNLKGITTSNPWYKNLESINEQLKKSDNAFFEQKSLVSIDLLQDAEQECEKYYTEWSNYTGPNQEDFKAANDKLNAFYFFWIPFLKGDLFESIGDYKESYNSFHKISQFESPQTPIDLDVAWNKLARAYLNKIDLQYKGFLEINEEEKSELIKAYQQICYPEKHPNNPLFEKRLRTLKDDILEITNLVNKESAIQETLQPQLSEVVSTSLARIRQLEAGLNFAGIHKDYLPIVRFSDLQAHARRFTDLAIQSHRELISFTSRAEAQSFAVSQLEHTANISKRALKVEEENYSLSNLEHAATSSSISSVKSRLNAVRNALVQHQTNGHDLYNLDWMSAWIQMAGSNQNVELTHGSWDALGVRRSGSKEDVYQSFAEAKARRVYQMREAELNDMVIIRENELKEAEKRQKVQQKFVEVARLKTVAARARSQESQALLEERSGAQLNKSFFAIIATRLQLHAKEYLHRAIDVAFLMEKAFHYEYGININRIALDYGSISTFTPALPADQLRSDIEYFAYYKSAEIQYKSQAITKVISLSDTYPEEFLENFRQTGKMWFTTKLIDLHFEHPGVFNERIKQIEIKPEGVMKGLGPIGTLNCSNFSRIRRKTIETNEFAPVSRYHSADTLHFSKAMPKRAFLFGDVRESELGLFENIGYECEWCLDFPKYVNDPSVMNLTDVKIIITCLVQHDESLKKADLDVIKEKKWTESLSFSLSTKFRSSFRKFRQSGKMVFDISEKLASNHSSSKSIGIQLFVFPTIKGIKMKVFHKKYPEPEKVYITTERGQIMIQENNVQTGNHSIEVDGPWNIEIVSLPEGFELIDLKDIYFVLDYEYRLLT